MQLNTVSRKQTHNKIALQGLSGSGKTYSALLLAYGITNNWQKIALIDTCNQAATLYSHLGPFTTISLGAPFHPSRFYEALDLAIDAGMEVVIIDSLSPEWSGEGGVFDRLAKPYSQDALRDHRNLLSFIINSPAHIICTLESRQRFIRKSNASGSAWQVVETPLQQEGIEYLFTTVLRVDKKHRAHVVKDRTGLFTDRVPASLQTDHGVFLYNWSKQGEPEIPEELKERIDACASVPELHQLLATEDTAVEHIFAFTKRRLELEGIPYLNAIKGEAGNDAPLLRG